MAVGLLTAWRVPGDDSTEMIRVATSNPDVTPPKLIAALLELLAGMVQSSEISIDRILATRELLAVALRRCEQGFPVTAADVQCDAVSSIRRAGVYVASTIT